MKKAGCGFDGFPHVLEFSNFDICCIRVIYLLLELWDMVDMFHGYRCMGPRGRFYPYLYILHILGCLGHDMQVLYLGRAPHTKETLPDFLKWRRVTRPPLVFRGLTGSQRTPGF